MLYELINKYLKDKLIKYIDILIFQDESMRENELKDIHIRLTPYNQRTASSILENANILEVKYIDIPQKPYYRINEINLLKVLKDSVVDNMKG